MRKLLLCLLLCVFLAGCIVSGGGYGSGGSDPYGGIDYNTYNSPSFELPEVQYNTRYNITERDYGRIRDMERMNDRLKRLEGINSQQQEASSRLRGPLGGGSMPGDSLLR